MAATFRRMDTYPLAIDDVPTVIAGLEALAQDMRLQPSDSEEATSLLEEQATHVDALAHRLDDWLRRHIGPYGELPGEDAAGDVRATRDL